MSKTARELVTRETTSNSLPSVSRKGKSGDWTGNPTQATLYLLPCKCKDARVPHRDSSCKLQHFDFSFVCLAWEHKGNHGWQFLFQVFHLFGRQNRFGPERISRIKWSYGSEDRADGTSAFGNSSFHKSSGWQMASGYRFVFKNLFFALWVGFHMDLIKLKNEMIQKAGFQIAPSLFLVWIWTPTVYYLSLGSLQIPISLWDHHTLLRRYEQPPCLHHIGLSSLPRPASMLLLFLNTHPPRYMMSLFPDRYIKISLFSG